MHKDYSKLSDKQLPVYLKLRMLLDLTKEVAAAITDNAVDDSDPLSNKHYHLLMDDIKSIQASINSARYVYTSDQNTANNHKSTSKGTKTLQK